MISVVCVYNNEIVLNNYLIKSLMHQTVEFELIRVNNTNGKFSSAAAALNYGGEKAKCKYIMFVHQDVDLSSNKWLEDAEKLLDSIPNLGIAGVMGMSEEGRTNEERGRNIIQHGTPPTTWCYGRYIQKPEPVQTVDECLIIIPRHVFNILRFDEKVCNGWHLYAVDYCLSVRKISLEVYVIPMFIYHKMGTVVAPDYFFTLFKVLRKHRSNF
ncbi:MAG: glycosyltransferase, partial [Elusimicrobiota bacterium]|nr:glycosyltransferase [Elusimicrobiota bacterium]